MFVDEELHEVYGNYISELRKNIIASDGIKYPDRTIAKGIILFSMDSMIRNIVLL
jgi:hypothetical protein